MFDHKTLVITGGTGTFGNAVLARFLETSISEIRVYSRDEKKQYDMRNQYPHEKLKFYIGDVRDPQGLEEVMRGADYVFHAAALKQVPSCEFFPLEAVRTNVLGTENVLGAAVHAGVSRIIVLSTDKAVYPINAMGISKAMMEKIAIARSRSAGPETTICVTRYGNVMASRGSVIPLFLKQLQEGAPLSITDPDMSRFMMTIEDAVDLVLYAFEFGRSGDTFVQKAPSSTIGVLAEALQGLLGRTGPLRVIGTRHGEKLFETLLTREEMTVAEDLGGYYRVPADNRDLNYGKYFTEGEKRISQHVDYNSHNVELLNVGQMQELLQRLDCVQRALRGEPVPF